MQRLFAIAVSAVALATSVGALAADYVIVARSQGAGSTDLDASVAAARGKITGRQPDIGVAFVSSNSSTFMSDILADPNVQFVAEDIKVPWIPAEDVVTGTAELAAAVPVEPRQALQWNLGAVRADVAHNNGDLGSGVKRALGGGAKEWISFCGYVVAVPLAFVSPLISIVIYVAVAFMWFIPDRRFERNLQP